MNTPLLAELVAATERLRDDSFWAQLLSENVAGASRSFAGPACEGFLQSSILGAFNLTSDQHMADREKRFRAPIANNCKPDLIVFNRDKYASWEQVRDSSSDVALLGLCRAALEVKIVYTRGSAGGGSALSSTVNAVVTDVQKLQQLCRSFTDCGAYLGTVICGRHPPEDGPERLSEARNTIQARVSSRAYLQETATVALLTGRVPEHRRRLNGRKPAMPLWAEWVWMSLGRCL